MQKLFELMTETPADAWKWAAILACLTVALGWMIGQAVYDFRQARRWKHKGD